MFNFRDVHWIAVVLNPRTRMLKVATDDERAHAYSLIRAEIIKLMDQQQTNENSSASITAIINSSTPRQKNI